MDSSWRSRAGSLPILTHIDRIVQGIGEHRCTVLQASPGSGKTTLLPLALAEQSWLEGKKILVLQPRRIAAKGVATRMSELLGEQVGTTVGYRIRLENRVTARTQIEVLTEGLLTRKILSDPDLRDVGAIVFDEFHERSIHADIGLALAHEISSVLRDDLRIVIMSATLTGSLPAAIAHESWSYSFEGTPHPVSVYYQCNTSKYSLWDHTARIVKDAAQRYEGDILVFLPGVYEIEKTRSLLEQGDLRARIVPLYGDLSYAEQQRALTPDPHGVRKTVLATPIAETSLTIEGIRVVVDCGLHKVPRTDSHGITSLRTEQISRDAAEQRAGRAGRTAPGVCIRLWGEHDHATLRPAREPEILRVDITQTVLDLATWGVRDAAQFSWITPPPKAALDIAVQTLTSLGALDQQGVTALGKVIAQLGTHPRFGRMLLEARRYELHDIAATLIPLLEERDIFPSTARSVSLNDRVEVVSKATRSSPAIDRMRQLKKRWLDRIEQIPFQPLESGYTRKVPDAYQVGFLLCLAFPDRIAQRREPGSGKYLMASGGAATLRSDDPLREHHYIVIASLQDAFDDARIFLAAELHEDLLLGPLQHLLTRERVVSFDETRGALTARVITRIGDIVLREEQHHQLSETEMQVALIEWLATSTGFSRLQFTPQSQGLKSRLAWARSTYPDAALPDLSDQQLRVSLSHWLAPFLPERATLQALSSELLERALSSLVSWSHKRLLDELAPETLNLPSGRSRQICYAAASPPVLSATIQELFGWRATPTIGPKRIPITLNILSPARRPMQITQDLASFWANGYLLVRKELRGRYPKHRWPEDPANGEN